MLSLGQAGETPRMGVNYRKPEGLPTDCYLFMDAAYQGDETLRLARHLGVAPVVVPQPAKTGSIGV